MSKVMLQLGQYVFSLDTAAYQRLKRSYPYSWQSQERIRRMPAQQYMGPGAQKITLNGTIYALFKGGLGQIDAMKKEANQGKPLLLVDGTGTVWGSWCIQEITETQAVFHHDGTPMKIGFNLQLIAYGDDA